MSYRTCSIESCGKRHEARGLCVNHYARMRRTGHPLGSTRKTPEQLFSKRLERVGDCVLYRGYIQKDGYGYMSVNGKGMLTHRFAWTLENGPIPEGMYVDHRYHCDRACVNVSHLRLATQTENRRNLAGASYNSRSGYRNVYPEKNRWGVRVRKDKVEHYFGSFLTVEEAAARAAEARAELFGDFAGRG